MSTIGKTPEPIRPELGSIPLAKGKSTVVAIPAHLLATATGGTALLSTTSLTKGIAGISYGAAWIIDKSLQLPGYLFHTGAVQATLTTLEPMTREVLSTAVERAVDVREAQGEVVQQSAGWAEKGLKAARLIIPFSGVVTEAISAGVEFGKDVEKKSRELEVSQLGYVRKGLSAVVSGVKALVPAGFWLFDQGAQVLRKGTGAWMNKSYEIWTNPQAPEQRFLNVKDRISSFSSRIWHCFKEVHAPLKQEGKAVVAFEEVEVEELEAFEEKISGDGGQEYLQELLYLIGHAPNFSLPQGKMREYQHAVDNVALSDAIKRELCALEKLIPQDLLSPQLFSRFDELVRIKLFDVVRKYAELSPSERSFLLGPDFRHLKIRGDWEKIPLNVRNRLEELLVEKFNTLSEHDRERILHISVEQFKELDVQGQKGILDAVLARVEDPTDKKRVASLQAIIQKEKALHASHDINTLLKLFNRLYPGEEKLEVYSQCTHDVVLCPVSHDQISALIEELKEKNDPAQESLINWLESQKVLMEEEVLIPETGYDTEVLKIEGKKIDASRIEDKIGLHVGPGRAVGERMGMVMHYPLTALGLPAWALMSGVGYLIKPHGIEIPVDSPLATYLKPFIDSDGFLRGSRGVQNFENWVEYCLSGAANLTEVALLLPLVPDLIIGKLGAWGFPVEEMEKMLRIAPAVVSNLFLTLASCLPGLIRNVKGPVAWLASEIEVYKQGEQALQTLGQLPATQAIEAGRIPYLTARVHEYVESACECLPENPKELFICRPEVYNELTKVSFWQHMAQELNLPPESPEFYQAFIDHLERGSIPMPATAVTEDKGMLAAATTAVADTIKGLYSGAVDVGNEAKEKMYGLLGYLYANTVGATKYRHLVEPVAEEIVAPIAEQAIVGVTETVAAGAATLAEGARAGGHIVSRALGWEQAVPEELKTLLKALSDQFGRAAQVKALEETARLTLIGFEAQQKQFYGPLIGWMATSESLSSFAAYYTNTLNPALEQMADATAKMCRLGQGGQKFLEAQLTAERPEALLKNQMDSAFSALQKQMSDALGKEGAMVKDLVSGAGAFGTLFQMASGSYKLLPVVLRHTIPPLLRVAAKSSASMGQNLFYGIAERSYRTMDATGEKFQQAFTEAGGVGQYAFNWLAKGRYVTQERIDNFLTLTNEEKQHIIEVAVASRGISDHDKTFLQNSMPIHTKNLQEQQKIAECAIKAYDSLATDEKLLISYTYYAQLDASKQEKIVDLVEKYVGLNQVERQDFKKIVEKFNQLPEKYKKKVDQFSLAEYGARTESEQENILFQLAHSSAYFAHEVGFPLLDADMTPSELVTWQMEQFARLQKLPGKELEKLLLLYQELEPVEQNIITPSQLRDLSATRIKDLVSLLVQYNHEVVATLKSVKGASGDLRKFGAVLETAQDATLLMQKKELIYALAFALNKMRPHQQEYVLLYSKGEFQELEPDQKKAFIGFLLAQPLSKSEVRGLKQALVKLEAKGSIDSQFVVDIFNARPVLVQAAFRQQNTGFEAAKHDTHATVLKEIEEIVVKLKIADQHLSKQMGRMSGMQLLIEDAAGKDMTKLEAELKSLGEFILHLEGTRKSLLEELDALSLLLPEEERKKYQVDKGAPLPPEWLAYIERATSISTKSTVSLFQAAAEKILAAIVGTPAEFIATRDAQLELFTKARDEARLLQRAAYERSSEYIEESEKEKDPAKRIVLQFKASFAQRFYIKLHEQQEKALDKALQDLTRRADIIYDAKYPKDPVSGVGKGASQEDIDGVEKLLSQEKSGGTLTSDTWVLDTYLRPAVGGTFDPLQQTMLTTHNRKVIAGHLTAEKKPVMEKRVQAFKKLSPENQLAVLLVSLQGKKKHEKHNTFFPLFFEALDRHVGRASILGYLGNPGEQISDERKQALSLIQNSYWKWKFKT